jgi:hypothetical protein
MEIKNDIDLEIAVKQAGGLLQDIQDYCKKKDLDANDFEKAKVRFPRGYIRTADFQRKRLSFISEKDLRSNLAYTLILSDTITWLLFRTDIVSTAAEMLRKLYLFLAGTLVESITQNYLKGQCNKNYKKRTEFLLINNIISSKLKDDLDWLWDSRNKMHLFLLEKKEYENDYNVESHRRCVRTVRGLLKALQSN